MTSTTTRPTGAHQPPGRPREVVAAPRPRRRGTGRLIFGLPGGVVLLTLSIYPVLLLFRMSVSDVSGGTLNQQWPLIGTGNFEALVAGGELTTAALNTVLFVATVTAIGVVGGLGVAIALRSNRRSGAILLALMVFVWALPPVVNGSVWKFLLADDGLLNTVLRGTGIAPGGVPFLFDADLALVSVALVNAWAVIPFNALVFRSALLNVDPEVLEAAAIDGATRRQEIVHILIPSARPTAVILTILTVVYAFRSFDFIYVMTAGGPGTATTTLPYLSYVQAFTEQDYGLGAATAVLSLVIVAALAVIYVRNARKESA